MEKKRRKRTKVRYLTFETTNQLTLKGKWRCWWSHIFCRVNGQKMVVPDRLNETRWVRIAGHRDKRTSTADGWWLP